MKCPNCGANYRTRETSCPYCGTANPKGELWRRQRESAEREYSHLEAAEGKTLRLKAAHKVLNRVLLFECGALALFLLGVLLWFLLSGAALKLRTRLNREQLQQQMQQLYDTQQLTALNDLMDEYDLFGEENYEYAQAALMGCDYDRFCLARMEYFAAVQADELPDEYLVQTLVSSMNAVLVPYMPAYPRLTENNKLLHTQLSEDVLNFARGWLQFGKEEVALLYSDWLTTEQETFLEGKIAEVTK